MRGQWHPSAELPILATVNGQPVTYRMAKDLAIVLNNGGVNSAVITAAAAQKFRPVLVYAEAGSPGSRMRVAYDQQVAHFKPYREHTVPLTFAPAASASPTTFAADPRLSAPIGPQLLDLVPLLAVATRIAAQYP